MSKNELNIPKKIKVITAWYSLGYQPTFHRCPNCNHVLTWQEKDKLKCRCGQLLLKED